MTPARPHRFSIVVAGHNEGELLLRTIESCLETTGGLDPEIVIADDASSDGSVQTVLERHPGVKVVSSEERRGGPATKDTGARFSTGDVIVFLDGHCKPEPFAIEKLVNDVEDTDGKAIVTPRIPALDAERWENSPTQIGYGYRMKLEVFHSDWLGLDELVQRDRLFECPALMGCCMAVSRDLYEELWGFDRHMVDWGVEDLDLGLKSWLLGYPVLHDPFASIGHRFRKAFDSFSVTDDGVLVNQMRMARKNFLESNWNAWIELTKAATSGEIWHAAWTRFGEGRESVEREREYLGARRVHDEHWYARRFGLSWPPS